MNPLGPVGIHKEYRRPIPKAGILFIRQTSLDDPFDEVSGHSLLLFTAPMNLKQNCFLTKKFSCREARGHRPASCLAVLPLQQTSDRSSKGRPSPVERAPCAHIVKDAI